MDTVLALLLISVAAYFGIRFLGNNPHVLVQIRTWLSELRTDLDRMRSPLESQPASQTASAATTEDLPAPAARSNTAPEQPAPTVNAGLTAVATAEPPVPLPAILKTGPTRKLQLRLRRAQRSGVMGRVIFTLDARIEPSPEQLALIRKYDLGKMIVYDSEARKRHAAVAEAHIDAAQVTSAGSPLKSLWQSAKGAARAAAAAFALRCTIESLIAGQHIECKDLNELLGAEEAIKDACETTKAFLDVAVTFDGREEVLEY